jgi:hypothetical protein
MPEIPVLRPGGWVRISQSLATQVELAPSPVATSKQYIDKYKYLLHLHASLRKLFSDSSIIGPSHQCPHINQYIEAQKPLSCKNLMVPVSD